MGGDIGVVSALGQGSTFAMEVPAPPAFPAEPGPAAGARIRRVLVSVDDLSVPDGLAQALGRAGFRMELTGAQDGLRFAREDRPEGIVMDIAPPVRNGEALLEELRMRSGWEALPALVVASVALSAEEQSRLAAAGVVAVLDASARSAADLQAMVAALVGPPEGRRVDA
jgi:CheY-like chemotaxis protein